MGGRNQFAEGGGLSQSGEAAGAADAQAEWQEARGRMAGAILPGTHGEAARRE